MEAIPSLNLQDFIQGNPHDKLKFVENLGKAFNDIGFVAISGHGLTDSITENLYQVIQSFFALPENTKLKYEIPGIFGQRGYVGKRKETAKGHHVPDLKEFYHVGQPHRSDGDSVWNEYPKNVFPTEIPEFETLAIQTFQILENAGKELLKAIALYLKLEENYFESKVKSGNSLLRAIHYFPILEPESFRLVR